MKNFNLIEMAKAMKEHKLRHMWRYAAMIFAVLVMSMANVGTAWAYWYLPGTIHYNAWGNGDNQMNGDNTIVFYAVPAGTYYFKLSNGTSQSGHDILSSVSGSAISSHGTDGAQTTITLSKAADLTFHVTNESTWMVSVVASAPSYMIKYKWNNGDWAWSMPMTDNGDGTYSCVGQYGGTSYNKIKKSQNHTTGDSGTATKDGFISNGNMCVFTYTASTGALHIRKCNSITKTNHFYFDNTNAGWSETHTYFVIGRPIDASSPYSTMYGDMNQIANTNLWYSLNGSDSWSDAAYFAIAGGSSAWDSKHDWGPTALSGWAKYSAPCYTALGMVNNGCYVITKADGSNGGAIAVAKYGSSAGYSTLNNLKLVFKYTLSTNGGSTYSDMSSGKTPSKITMDWYKFSALNAVTAQSQKKINAGGTSSYSNYAESAGYRTKTTLEVSDLQDGYEFVGWYDGDTEKSTATTYTYYPAANCTIAARFKTVLVTSITLNKTSTTLTAGGTTETLTATVLPSNALDKAITWTTSNSAVATVNSSGVVTPVAAGSATITATAHDGSGKSATCNVTVEAGVPTHTLTWNLAGGTVTTAGTAAGSVAEGATLTAPTVIKEGYDFAGWSPAVPSTMPSDNAAYTATWTKVYATTKDFSTNKTQGTPPNQMTITTAYASYTPFRVDNFFFGATNKLCFESGNADAKYNGWKFQYSGATIKFFVENDCSVAVAMGANAGCSIKYTPIDGSETTENLSTSDNQTTTKDVKGGTMVTLTTTSGSTVTLKSITITDKASCSTDPTVTAGSNSAVTTTTATVSCASGISSLGSAGCSITSYGFVIGTSANPAIGGSGVTQHQVGTSYASTGTSFSKNLTGLTAGTTYYVRPYATNGNGTAYGDQTSFTTLPTTPTFSPASGSTVNGSQTITITGHSGSTVYYVWATSTQSASDIYNSGSGSHGTADAGTASVTVQSGKTLYAISRISDTNSAVGSASYTVDATAPSVSSATPASSATDVSISGNVTFTFSENVTIVDASKFAISPSAGVTWSTGSATVDGATVTIPYSGLSYSTVYTISAAAGAVKDAVNNTSTAWAGHSFTTEAELVLYTVTYTYNGATGGSSTESSTQASSGASVTLPTPTKTNYTFQGWYESGGTKAGDGGDSYTPTADITVYALWRADCAGGGGGGGTLFSQNFNSATEVAYENRNDASLLINKNSSNNIVGTTAASQFTSIAAAKKDKTGIAINTTSGGNSVNASGFFQTYYDNTSGYWSVTKTTDFATTAPTAIKMSMDLYFDTKSSSGSCELVNFAIGDGFSDGLMSTSAQSSSNVHSGWGIAQNSKKICGYTANGTILYNTALSESTWYSITWVINNTGEDLTYDDPDGSGTTTLANDKFDIWLKTQAQTATNYTKVVTAAATTTSKALQELYFGHISGKKNEFRIDNIVVADLTPSSGTCYYVTYNGNGATGGYTKDETAYALNADPTVASNSFTKTGYTFTGWNTLANGTGDPYAAGGTISDISADVTLYAQWAADATTYELTWNTNGGSDLACSGTCTSGDLAYGATIVAPTDPTKSNYTFDGWNTADDGSGSGKASTMPASDVTYYAAWKQTVTLKTGLQGSDGDKTPYIYWNGTALSDDAVHSAAGYTLNGYYTASTGGTKVLNADGTFAAANVTDYITSSKWSRTGAAPTLYAQWRAAAGKTCYTWDASETHPQTGTTNYDGLYLTATTKAKNQANSALTDTIYDVSNNGKSLTGHINGAVIDSLIFGASTSSSGNTTFVVSFCSTQTFDTAKIIKVGGYHCTVYNVALNTAAASLTKIKAPAGTKSFVLSRNYMSDKLTSSASLSNSGSRYLYYVRACSASGGTHTISYNAGGGTGTMTSDADIADDGSQTLTTNSFTAPTNFAFAGWVADVDVTIGGSTVTAGTLIANGATITNITSDIALTAKWSQTITLDDNDANHGATGDGSATVYYKATSLASITHTSAASGYKLSGYYTAATSGTKVLNSDGSFASDDVTGYIEDGEWVQNDDDEPTLYAQYEIAGSIKWNLQVNSADAPIVTSSKNSSYTQISTSNMSNLTNSGLTVTASKKSELTSLISTPDTKGDDCMYVTFKVATGYKFTPSLIKAIIQPVGNGEHKAVEFSLADESSHTLASASATKCDGTSDGKKTTVTLAGDGTYFTGTVTLKIFVYKHADGTNSTAQYRLGTPIQIDGEIESTCTMPSYTSVSYSQTEYTVGDTPSSISVEDATGDPTYQWKYNSTGDRSSGTNGVTTASMSPSTASAGTTYYWCELTNACGTVKTPAVAITVSASKSDAPSIAWTDPASTPNYGGGGYTIRATVNDASWDGSASGLTITAPAGIRIYNTTTGTDGSSKKYIEVKFDVQTAFDRETYSSNIPFTVSADATTSYNAISADHNVSYSACSGGGGSATEELMAVDASHIDNSTWKGGWVYDGIGMMRYGHGSSDISAGTKDANLKDLSYTMASGDITKYYKSASNHFGFYTEKAITGIRLYVYTSNDNVTVSNVYVANSAYASGTPSSGAVSYEAEYNDDNDALRSGTHSGSAWVDITFDKEVAAEKYGQINLSNNVNIAGMAFISASGSGASLTTTLSFASSSVTKAQSDANFTITPTKGEYSETLGAITYSSSNTDCATVNATTGEVTITATGSSNLTSRITATLAASGCYKSATAYYDLTVTGQECTITSAGTLSADKTVKCSSANVTLTLSGEDDGMTVTWYRDATDVTASVLDHTLTTSAAGSYSVVVSNATCSKRSNSITISNYSAEVAATKIVDKWYIKHGRVTPDIALWALDEGTHLSSVAWSPSNATGLTAADDFYESDGIVYLKGTEPSSNESSDVEYTLTLTVKDECENTTALSTSDKQITLTHQKNTDKHVLAFVVTGTEKGGWTAGISADQTTNVELYNEIAKNFDVQATNIYSTDDEQKLKEYYSQFDILCITDYPNTGKTGTNKKSYVDAIGSLIDIRPILTMEAFVSKLDNWKSKGISGTPKSPTTRQYSMLLQCKDHEIFSGTNPTTVGSGDETMYRIDMVDKTQEEYVTLDATYGAGAHAEKSGYEYGSKPALQGFTYDASMSSLLPIGRIDDGAGNDLEVGVERQAVMEARLLVLGINGYAMERLDDDGQTIVINALKYLMKKNAEDISDCSNYFVGGAEGDPYSWKNLDNWSGSSLPDRTQEVRIVAPCVISDTIARASSVKIVTGGTYSRGTKTATGKLTIAPTGALIVDGKIYAATAPNFFEKRTTEPEDLVVEANSTKTGTLIFDNEDGETQATIEMYSPSHWEINPENGKYVKYWSYVGMPIKDVHIPDYFYGAFTYYYNEAKGWEKRFDNDIMQPFEGIGLSMQEGHKETFYGTMVSTENTDITITNHAGYGDGDNLIGNSWTAPIQIANFDADDFGSCWATVYIFNTGKGGNTYVNANADNDGAAKAGQWLGIPIGVAGLPEYTGLKVIPAMNAFLVHDTEPSSTILHLDYDKLVREDATTNTQINEKMRAPSRHPRKKKDVDGLMRIRVVGEKTNTDVWMLQDARFSEGFDNGWEARYNPCDDRSAQLYARSKVGVMSFIALPDLDGTVLGFAPSRDGNDYTFTFQYRGEDEYYLNDLKLQQSVLIDADNNYAFTYEKGDTNRFYVSRTPLAPQTPTGVDNASGATQSTKAIKVIYNDKLYIIRSGRVYSAEGILVK